MRVGESKPGFFAIASPPDPNNQGVVELLVKPVPETTSQLIADANAGALFKPHNCRPLATEGVAPCN